MILNLSTSDMGPRPRLSQPERKYSTSLPLISFWLPSGMGTWLKPNQLHSLSQEFESWAKGHRVAAWWSCSFLRAALRSDASFSSTTRTPWTALFLSFWRPDVQFLLQVWERLWVHQWISLSTHIFFSSPPPLFWLFFLIFCYLTASVWFCCLRPKDPAWCRSCYQEWGSRWLKLKDGIHWFQPGGGWNREAPPTLTEKSATPIKWKLFTMSVLAVSWYRTMPTSTNAAIMGGFPEKLWNWLITF